jgi:hypothetical protein
VLTVPPPVLAGEIGHGRLARAFWHRTLAPDRILRDQGRAPPADYRQGTPLRSSQVDEDAVQLRLTMAAAFYADIARESMLLIW